MSTKKWYELIQPEEVNSPGLIVYKERIAHNIAEMIKATGDANKLRPHIKTHKMAEIVQMQLTSGINKFKCATIAEAELLAQTEAVNILMAMQPVGPNIERFLHLANAYSEKSFACLVDNMVSVQQISILAKNKKRDLGVFIDLDTGMSRTGIAPENALEIVRLVVDSPGLIFKGLHAYDGHIRITDIEERKSVCNAAFARVEALRQQLEKEGIAVEEVVAGGSPSFYVHAKRENVIASPGTTSLWDEGYASKFPDMKLKHAAVLVTRLISKPKPNQFCLDLGHKALASEMAFPRVKFLNTDDFEQLSQSEEHFVVKVKNPEKYQIGDVFYAVPMHICPTVAKYPSVQVIENGKVVDIWRVAARDHKISF